MTFRIDDVSQCNLGESGGRFWHWRIKGVDGRGVYGSIVTDTLGRGLYVLEGPGILEYGERIWPRRARCLIAPRDSYVSLEMSPRLARELLALVLDSLGWGPRVDQAGEVIACSLLEIGAWSRVEPEQ